MPAEVLKTDKGKLILKLDPGDDVLNSIKAVIDKYDIQNGAIIAGIGSLKKLGIHYVTPYKEFPEMPEDENKLDENIESEAPWEVGNMQGTINDGEPHIHLTVYNSDENNTLCGHLEENTEVHTLMEIVLEPFEEVNQI